jgi:hypothetical protein
MHDRTCKASVESIQAQSFGKHTDTNQHTNHLCRKYLVIALQRLRLEVPICPSYGKFSPFTNSTLLLHTYNFNKILVESIAYVTTCKADDTTHRPKPVCLWLKVHHQTKEGFLSIDVFSTYFL